MMDHIITGYGGTNNLPAFMRDNLPPEMIVNLTEGSKWYVFIFSVLRHYETSSNYVMIGFLLDGLCIQA